MNCLNCSRDIPENALFCPWCGRKQIREKRKEIRVPAPRQLPSGKWYIYMMIDGVNYPVEADTEAECVTKARAIKVGLLEAKKTDTSTVGQKIDEYIADRSDTLRKSTLKAYKSYRKYHFQTLMPMRCSAVTDSLVQREINAELKKGPAKSAGNGKKKDELKKCSAKTVKNVYGLLTAALGRSFDVTIPDPEQKIPEVLSSDQIRQLLTALAETGGELECAALLAMWLSLRRSEIAGLRWEDIGTNTISVCNAYVYGTDGFEDTKTKTKDSTRVIPCPAYILDKINALPRSGEKVFTSHPNSYGKRLDSLCKKYGLPHIYLHGLRHTNASIMELLAIAPKYQNKRGGWSTDYVRQTVYTHTMTEGELQAAQKIDEYFGALVPSQVERGAEQDRGQMEQEQ